MAFPGWILGRRYESDVLRRSSYMVSANSQHPYVKAHLSPQLSDFLFQNVDPLFVPVALQFNSLPVSSCGPVLKSPLGSFMRLHNVYQFPFLPTDLILRCGLARVTAERWFYSPLFSLRLSGESGWGWNIFLYE